MRVQRRDAENAEISAEKTDQKEAEFFLFLSSLLFLLCAYLCVLCVSALKNMPRVEKHAPFGSGIRDTPGRRAAPIAPSKN
jgi:hypothetical protein